MTEHLDATSISALPLEIERLRRSKTWRKCRSEPFLAFHVVNLWVGAFHGVPAGSLEDDDESLAELSGCLPLDWPRIRPLALHGWQKRDDGRLYHPLIEAKAREALALRVSTKRVVKAAAELPRAVAAAFEAWWTEYPRKVAKGAARTAYHRALNKTGAEVLLNSAKAFARTVSLKDTHFIPHPATWLNQERWIDGKRSERATVTFEGPALGTWNGKAAPLVAAIGGIDVFQAWFLHATFEPGPPASIMFPNEFKRNWVASHYAPAIKRVIGECSLTVASEKPAP